MTVNEKKIKKNPDVSWRTIEGQAVLVHNGPGEIQVLNEVGTYVWEHLEEGKDQIIRSIAAEYNMDADTVKADVEEFILELLSTGALIQED